MREIGEMTSKSKTVKLKKKVKILQMIQEMSVPKRPMLRKGLRSRDEDYMGYFTICTIHIH